MRITDGNSDIVKEVKESKLIVKKPASCKILDGIGMHGIWLTNNLSLMKCHEIVTLLVGPSFIKMTCHKALLSFHSTFFDAACYGGFIESESNVVTLPEETADGICALIAWVYSGQLESSLPLEELWVLGDRLQSPGFANAAMYQIFDRYGTVGSSWMTAKQAKYVFDNTSSGSLLSVFTGDLVSTDGPLSPRAIEEAVERDKWGSYEEEWKTFIRKEWAYLALDVSGFAPFTNDVCIFSENVKPKSNVPKVFGR